MKSVDQAFIKAYAKQVSGQRPQGGPHFSPVRQDVADTRSRDQISLDPPGSDGWHRVGPSRMEPQRESLHVSAPHVPFTLPHIGPLAHGVSLPTPLPATDRVAAPRSFEPPSARPYAVQQHIAAAFDVTGVTLTRPMLVLAAPGVLSPSLAHSATVGLTDCPRAAATAFRTDDLVDGSETPAPRDATAPPRREAVSETSGIERSLRTASRRLTPAWEVEQFQWPDICDHLGEAASESLMQSGTELRAAALEGLRVLAVTGTRRGEGRTTLAICLAQQALQAGLRVALIDADGTRPDLSRRLGVEPPCSWLDAVAGRCSSAEAAVGSLNETLTLFPWSTSRRAPESEGHRRQASRWIRAVADAYDLLVLDLGPVAAATQLLAWGDACPVDAAIVVRDVRHTPDPELLEAVHQLRGLGVRAVGLVENFAAD